VHNSASFQRVSKCHGGSSCRLQEKTAPVRESLRAKAGSAIEPQTKSAVDQHAIEEGRKRLASRGKDLAAIRAKVTELYGISSKGLAPVAAIESLFKFTADLLHRCAIARSEHDRLQRDKLNLQLDLDRFYRLVQAQERERQADMDTLPYERAALESGAESCLEVNRRSAAMSRTARCKGH
jgi:hypothetical protein